MHLLLRAATVSYNMLILLPPQALPPYIPNPQDNQQNLVPARKSSIVKHQATDPITQGPKKQGSKGYKKPPTSVQEDQGNPPDQSSVKGTGVNVRLPHPKPSYKSIPPPFHLHRHLPLSPSPSQPTIKQSQAPIPCC